MIVKSRLALLSVAMVSAFASAATVREKQCLPKAGEQNCLSLEVTVPEYSQPWLTDFALQETFDRSGASLADLDGLVKEYISETLEQTEEPINDSEEVKWFPQQEAAGLVQIAKEDFAMPIGAAHGLFSTSYYVFNEQNPEQAIALKDILTSPEAEKQLGEMLADLYVTWQTNLDYEVTQAEAEDVANEYRNSAEGFPVSDNWYLAKDMIVFNYPPYEIGPYAYGNVDLPMPVTALKGLINDDILAAAQQWPVALKPTK